MEQKIDFRKEAQEVVDKFNLHDEEWKEILIDEYAAFFRKYQNKERPEKPDLRVVN